MALIGRDLVKVLCFNYSKFCCVMSDHFLFLFFLCVFHTITIYKSNYISNIYSLGYLLFCFCLLVYVLLIFFGPQIGPGKIFTEKELILQVVSQKIIVLIFTLAILSQVYGINKILKKKVNVA